MRILNMFSVIVLLVVVSGCGQGNKSKPRSESPSAPSRSVQSRQAQAPSIAPGLKVYTFPLVSPPPNRTTPAPPKVYVFQNPQPPSPDVVYKSWLEYYDRVYADLEDWINHYLQKMRNASANRMFASMTHQPPSIIAKWDAEYKEAFDGWGKALEAQKQVRHMRIRIMIALARYYKSVGKYDDARTYYNLLIARYKGTELGEQLLRERAECP